MSPSAPQPLPTPPSIVDSDGTVHVGWFAQPFDNANLQDASVPHLLSGLRGTQLGLLERGMRRWRLKEWHYTSVVTERVMFACAVVDAGYVGNAFAYVVDRATKKVHEYSALTPLGSGISIARNSVDGRTQIEWPGFGRIVLDNDAAAGTRRIEANLHGKLGRGARKQPPLRARFEIRDESRAPDPIIVVEESEPGRFLYTHKCYGLEAEGMVTSGAIHDEVKMGEALAGLDWNRGYRPRETYWNWAAGSGRLPGGQVVGFNLTAHRPWKQSAAASSSSHDEDAADCALWLGDRCEKLRRVSFDYNPDDLLAPWRVFDDEGLVDLRFTPDGKRAENVNLGLVVSRFHQPYGTFCGELRDRSGNRYSLDSIYGVTEQHFARW